VSIVGVDIGGTKILAAAVAPDGTIGATVRRPTPEGGVGELVCVIAEVVQEAVRDTDPVSGVGIGCAGWVSADRSRVLFAPNLTWGDSDIAGAVSRQLGAPVFLENDANAAGWAEWRFGAGRGHQNMVLITVGTGIGGGFIVDGRLARGGFGIAAEPGHLTVVPGGRRCGCGRRGCWEQYASGRALLREAQEIAALDPAKAARLLELAGGRADRLEGPEVTQAAMEGDVAAQECLEVVGRWLGVGLAMLATILDPSVIVVGGGAGEAGELLLGPAREAFAAELPGSGHRPLAPILAATLGNTAGVIGAADLARG
jgi:glucokinase